MPGQPPQVVYAYAQPQAGGGTNGFAIASIICAFLCAPLGLIFGFIARSQIKERHEGGDGLAVAGIVISLVAIALAIVYVILLITIFGSVVHTFNAFNNNTFNNLFDNAFQNLPTPTP